MLQEDSNGEASFEIIDKRASELSITGDKTESLSSVSSAYSLPSPSLVTSPGGNILSNVPPPSSIPDFTLYMGGAGGAALPPKAAPPPQQLPPGAAPLQPTFRAAPPVGAPPPVQQFPVTQFSAAIPPSKGVPQVSVPPGSAEAGQLNVGLGSGGGGADGGGGGGGFIGWMKEAVSSGGLLHKVAEKARSSVDTIITTLDPQMTEYIYSGGDMEVTLVSHSEEEIHLTREVFYIVFGKAWINGLNTNLPPKDGLAIGLTQGLEYAEEKITTAIQMRKTTTIAIEDVLLQHNQDFYLLSVILLRDPERNISLQTFSQATPIPVESFIKKAEKELVDYAKLSASSEKILAKYLQQCKSEWIEVMTSVSRRDIVGLALRSVVQMYKNNLELKQTCQPISWCGYKLPGKLLWNLNAKMEGSRSGIYNLMLMCHKLCRISR